MVLPHQAPGPPAQFLPPLLALALAVAWRLWAPHVCLSCTMSPAPSKGGRPAQSLQLNLQFLVMAAAGSQGCCWVQNTIQFQPKELVGPGETQGGLGYTLENAAL